MFRHIYLYIFFHKYYFKQFQKCVKQVSLLLIKLNIIHQGHIVFFTLTM